MLTDRTNLRFPEAPSNSLNKNTIATTSQGSYKRLTSKNDQSVVGKICGWVGHFGFGIVSGLYEIARNSLCPRKKSTSKTERKTHAAATTQTVIPPSAAVITSIGKSLVRKVHFNPIAQLYHYDHEETPRRRIAQDRDWFMMSCRSKPSRRRYDITAYTSRDQS